MEIVRETPGNNPPQEIKLPLGLRYGWAMATILEMINLKEVSPESITLSILAEVLNSTIRTPVEDEVLKAITDYQKAA